MSTEGFKRVDPGDVKGLMDRHLCRECPFFQGTDCVKTEKSIFEVILCERRDCDNWDRDSERYLYHVLTPRRQGS